MNNVSKSDDPKEKGKKKERVFAFLCYIEVTCSINVCNETFYPSFHAHFFPASIVHFCWYQKVPHIDSV